MSDRIEGLDSVRGLAAVAVVLSHEVIFIGMPLPLRPIGDTPIHLLWDGSAAVALFFVLSGLVLSRRPLAASSGRVLASFDIPSFAVARVVRIWLPFAVALALSAAAYAHLWDRTPWPRHDARPDILQWWGPTAGSGLLGEAALVLPSSPHGLIPQGWTLSVELAASLFVPILCLACARDVRWLVLTVVVCVGLLGMPVWIAHFGMGIAVAALEPWLRDRLARRARGARAAVAVGAFALLSFRFGIRLLLPFEVPGVVTWLAVGVGAAALLAVVLSSEGVRKCLRCQPLPYLGRISYSLYLVHVVPLLCAGPALARWADRTWPGEPVSAFVAFTVACLAVCIAGAAVFHHLVERPSTRLSQEGARRLRGRLGRGWA